MCTLLGAGWWLAVSRTWWARRREALGVLGQAEQRKGVRYQVVVVVGGSSQVGVAMMMRMVVTRWATMGGDWMPPRVFGVESRGTQVAVHSNDEAIGTPPDDRKRSDHLNRLLTIA